MIRIAVRYKNKPLMPMKASRCSRYVKEGKGKIRYDRKLKLHYLDLLINPRNLKTQDVILGIDLGSMFDGFSVVSQDTHHCNFELIQRAKKGQYSIKKFMERRAMNRRLRRRRLWHRPIRFSNRTGSKLSPTIRANVDMRKWLINKLSEYYPITKVVVEDAKFNHFKSNKGKSFSHVEQGKTELYRFIRERVILETRFGHETHKLRSAIFGYDPKVKDKGSKSFFAHCVDSFVIALDGIELHKQVNVLINHKVIFIQKILYNRRQLTQLRPRRYKGNNSFYRLLPGGIRVNYENISKKINKCRIKIAGDHSNHPKRWEFIDNGYAVKSKSKIRNFGGTSLETYFKNNEFINRRFV
jgi:hypothetical protein